MSPIESYADTIRQAARSMAVFTRRLGWDIDDCEQEARLYLMQHPRVFDGLLVNDRMIYVVARRAISRATRRLRGTAQVEQTFLEELEDRRGFDVTLVLDDLISAATPGIYQYLKLRMFEGMTWAETCEAMGVSNTRLATIRAEAGVWLLSQLEAER